MSSLFGAVTSLCPECLSEIPGKIVEEDGMVWLEKQCESHPLTRTLLEKDASVYRSLGALYDPEADPDMALLTNSCMINTTDHCNLNCPSCYHPVQDSEDPSIGAVVDVVRQTKAMISILAGAEPTTRKDLPELVRVVKGVGKFVGLYTNGINLEDKGLVARLKESGLDGVCLSMHCKDHVLPWQWEAKHTAVKNLVSEGVPVNHIAFTMQSPGDLEGILMESYNQWDVPHHFRVRIPGRIGKSASPVFFSDLLPRLDRLLQRFGWSGTLIPGDNNPYHLNISICGKRFRFIRWPSLEEVVLDYLQGGPTAMFLPGLGERNFVYQALIQAHRKGRK